MKPELHVVTLLWDANPLGKDFSSMYDETWVAKLYRGFERNLTLPFRFLCWTDRPRKFKGVRGIGQVVDPALGYGGYADCIKPYQLDKPMVLVGLDTLVLANIDHLAQYVLQGKQFALPRDPYRKEQACNGVALVPTGMRKVFDQHDGITDDMSQVRKFSHSFLDDLFPGQVKSYKGHIKRYGWPGVRIAFFHGKEKPHELLHDPVIREHWA